LGVAGRIRVELNGHLVQGAVGDEVEVVGLLARPGGPRNPGAFDFRRYLRSDGLLATVHCGEPEDVRVVQSGGNRFRRLQGRLRSRAEQMLQQKLSARTAPVGIALLLGTRTGIPDELRTAFAESGTMHILAISGSNVGILAGLLWVVSHVAGFGRTGSVGLILTGVLAYSFVADAQPPVMRAVLMIVATLAGRPWHRDGSLVNGLALAALGVLVWNPAHLFDVGAQLSFLAVAGLIWAPSWSRAWREAVGKPTDPLEQLERPLLQRWVRSGQKTLVTLHLTIAAIWLFTLPLTMARFNLVSPVGFVVPVTPPAFEPFWQTTDKETVKFREEVRGLRVVGGYVNVLFSADGSLLCVQSTAMPHLSGFDTTPALSPRGASAIAAATFETRTGLPPTRVDAPELVIDPITDRGLRAPVLAYLVNVRWEGSHQNPVGWRYSIDARTGAVVRQERSIHFDVSGTVSAMTSPGTKPDEASNPPAAQVLKYLKCTSSAGTVYTDANGNFNYPGVNVPLSVTFEFAGGLRADVNNLAGPNASTTLLLPPNQANPILLNSPASATVTAQANGTFYIAKTGDFIHSISPTDAHADFSALALVNQNLTCDAYYDGVSTHYYLAGGGCVNTAYSSLFSHEIGHWMNDLYGTNNGGDGMGEGNADTWSEYILESPIIAEDFCGIGCILRTGENTRPFCGDCCGGCYGEVHADGEVWMGTTWKIRTRLQATNGQALGGIIANGLFLGWMNAFNQSQIKSIIETQWLILDDDDGDLHNGTPHFDDIDGGFRAQGFPGVTFCPLPTNYCVTSPNSADPSGATMGWSGTNFVSSNNFVLLAFGCPPDKTAIFFYGQGQTNLPYGNGRRCVAAPLFRLPVITSDLFGDLQLSLNLNALPPGGPITAGQTWNFQAYYRDPAAGGAMFNATDGLRVLWCQ
jgi:ComEC/Rec2-related protein